MKVSNGINVTRIYQEQFKKAQNKTTSDNFSNLLGNVTNESVNVSNASALKHAAKANLDIALSNAQSEKVDPAKVFEFAAGAVANSPEVREEKVARIKALFDAGQYNISPEAVAEKLWASGVLTASWEG
jgi:anti-sigma28 factor (negative regulator of flagellin synthesis)